MRECGVGGSGWVHHARVERLAALLNCVTVDDLSTCGDSNANNMAAASVIRGRRVTPQQHWSLNLQPSLQIDSTLRAVEQPSRLRTPAGLLSRISADAPNLPRAVAASCGS